MKPPDLTPIQYAALSVLLDGTPHGTTTIARAIQFHRPGSFAVIVQRLRRRGLVERVRSPQLARNGYRITASGRRAWQETLQFYVYFAERFGNAKRVPSSAAQRARPLPFPVDGPRVPDRSPNEAECEAIEAAASKPFRPLFRAMRLGPLSLDRLMGLAVTDVDLQARTVRIRVRGRTIALPVGSELVEVLAQAIGDRRGGPAFTTFFGTAWTILQAREAFRNGRNAAGVSRDVKLRGRVGSRRRRELAESSV